MCAHLLWDLKNCNSLLNKHWQENVGSYQEKITQVQEQRRSPSKTVGGTKSCLESNPIPARDAWRTKSKSCVHQDPDTPQRVSQACLWVLSVSGWDRVSSGLRGDRASGRCRPGTNSFWYKSSWRRSPLTPPYSHWADDLQTAEQLYQRNPRTVKKVLWSTVDFPTWGSI